MLKIFLIFLALNINLFSQSIVTDRPDQTESAITVPKKTLQIETGILYETTDTYFIDIIKGKQNIQIERTSYLNSLFRYGLTDYMELRIVTSFDKISGQIENIRSEVQGISDIQVGYKINILDGDFSLGFLHHLITKSGSQYISTDEISTFAKLAAAYSFIDNFSLSANIGYNYAESTQYIPMSLSFGFSITEKLGLFAEIYGAYEIEYNKSVIYYNNGITYLINDNLQADFSFGTGLEDRYNFYSAGISWLIR